MARSRIDQVALALQKIALVVLAVHDGRIPPSRSLVLWFSMPGPFSCGTMEGSHLVSKKFDEEVQCLIATKNQPQDFFFMRNELN